MKRRASRSGESSPRKASITIRGIGPALARRIDAMARKRGTSRSRAALQLLCEGAGLTERGRPRVIGHALDWFIGTWTEEEEREFREATEEFGEVDPEMWK